MPTPGTATKMTPAVSTTGSWTHTTVSGEAKMHVFAYTADATTRGLAGCTFNGTALTRLDGADDGVWSNVELWELNDPPIGAFTVELTALSSTSVHIGGHAISYSNAAAVNGTVAKANSTTANPSLSVSSASGDLVVGAVNNDNSTGATTEGGTLIAEDEDVGSDNDFNSQRVTASGSSTSLTWTQSGSGDGWAAIGVAVKSASGGAPDSVSVSHLD